MSEEPLYVASAWGSKYHALGHDEALGAGAAGPGKSFVLLMDPLQQITVEHNRCADPDYLPPGFTEPQPLTWGNSTGVALHLRRTLPMLTDTVDRSKRMFTLIDPGATYNANDMRWTFSSGFKVEFGHCKDPDDWNNYLSREFSHVGYDELVQFNEEQYNQINTRVRSSDPVLRTMLKKRAMSNPMCGREHMDGAALRDPHWVRNYFVRPWPQGGKPLYRTITRHDGSKERISRIYLRATLFDNPNKDFVRKYEIDLLSAKPHIRQAMLYGNWEVTVGSFFGDVWNDRVHCCEPFAIPSDWPVFRSMDWGFKAPGCVHWYALSPDKELFVFREYTFQGKDAAEVAKRIRQIEEDEGLWKGDRSLVTGPADTQLWEKRGEVGKSKAEEMQDLGVRWVPADKKSRERNAQRVYARLEDHKSYTQPPGLVFFRRCKMAIQTIPGIQTEPNNPECPMDGGEDHWFDSICYGVAFASRGTGGIPKRRKDDWDDEKPKNGKKGGGFGYGF